MFGTNSGRSLGDFNLGKPVLSVRGLYSTQSNEFILMTHQWEEDGCRFFPHFSPPIILSNPGKVYSKISVPTGTCLDNKPHASGNYNEGGDITKITLSASSISAALPKEKGKRGNFAHSHTALAINFPRAEMHFWGKGTWNRTTIFLPKMPSLRTASKKGKLIVKSFCFNPYFSWKISVVFLALCNYGNLGLQEPILATSKHQEETFIWQ